MVLVPCCCWCWCWWCFEFFVCLVKITSLRCVCFGRTASMWCVFFVKSALQLSRIRSRTRNEENKCCVCVSLACGERKETMHIKRWNGISLWLHRFVTYFHSTEKEMKCDVVDNSHCIAGRRRKDEEAWHMHTARKSFFSLQKNHQKSSTNEQQNQNGKKTKRKKLAIKTNE